MVMQLLLMVMQSAHFQVQHHNLLYWFLINMNGNFKYWKIVILLFPLLSLSCGSNPNQVIAGDSVKITKDVNFRGNSFSIPIKINGLSKSAFKTKDSSSGTLAKGIEDIKCFSAFLSSNSTDPFAAGANPKGDGIVTSVNSNSTDNIVINFSNIHNGTYFGVVAAFDGELDSGSCTGNNITEINPDISASPSQQWNVSSNNVTISGGFLVYSGPGATNALSTDLFLMGSTPAVIDSSVNLSDGASIGDLGASAS
jgi:hypothetical protein